LPQPWHHLAHGLGIHGGHHVAEIGLDLVMQMFRGMGEQVALLVHRAAPHRHIAPQAGKRGLGSRNKRAISVGMEPDLDRRLR